MSWSWIFVSRAAPVFHRGAMLGSLRAAEAGNQEGFQKPVMGDLALFLISDKRDATLAVRGFFQIVQWQCF